MHFKNLTAYMLGNKNHEYSRGEQWWPFDEQVWMCPNMTIAEKMLKKSQGQSVGAVWTDIYRISAKDIYCEQSNRGLYYTDTPTKIFVEAKVFSKPDSVNEDGLLENANNLKPEFFEILNNWKKRRKVK